MGNRNWCLFVATKHCGEVKEGESGVALTTLHPGIKDTPFGVMYVVPAKYIFDLFDKPPMAAELKTAILNYYNHK